MDDAAPKMDVAPRGEPAADMAAVRQGVAAARTCVRTEHFHSPSVWRGNRAIPGCIHCEGELVNGLIYLVGLIVVIMAILSIFGLR